MARPLIGITTYGRDAAGSYSLPACYVDAVRRAGGSALLLAPGDSIVPAALAGLVLAGGGDLDPALYGGKSHPTVYMTDAERDDSELALIRSAIEHGSTEPFNTTLLIYSLDKNEPLLLPKGHS